MKIKQNLLIAASIAALLFSCGQNAPEAQKQSPARDAAMNDSDKKQIAAMLDSFNLAAANADYEGYFAFYADGATFNGTDATENWDKNAFMDWAKPFFDRKKAWSFTSLDRRIYFGKYEDIAWFEELLNTQMKICRGSGVLVKEGSRWKVQQYVLSMTVPNSQVDKAVALKTIEEDSLIAKLGGK